MVPSYTVMGRDAFLCCSLSRTDFLHSFAGRFHRLTLCFDKFKQQTVFESPPGAVTTHSRRQAQRRGGSFGGDDLCTWASLLTIRGLPPVTYTGEHDFIHLQTVQRKQGALNQPAEAQQFGSEVFLVAQVSHREMKDEACSMFKY